MISNYISIDVVCNVFVIYTRVMQALMKFPSDYPYSPPSVRFLTKMWHPNVYEVGTYLYSLVQN